MLPMFNLFFMIIFQRPSIKFYLEENFKYKELLHSSCVFGFILETKLVHKL